MSKSIYASNEVSKQIAGDEEYPKIPWSMSICNTERPMANGSDIVHEKVVVIKTQIMQHYKKVITTHELLAGNF